MAKILKQLSTMPGRLFAGEPEKSRPPELFIDADALDVYALRRSQSDLSPLYLTRLSLSSDDLHAATLPPPRNLLDTLQEFRVKGRGVMRRVRHHYERERANAVSRSDSFKFQSAGERGDHVIAPPRRRGRKKGSGPPSMPQLLEDYAAPLDLVNRAKFRQVSRSDASKVVQIDEDYSDVADSKDYVTPGEDGTRKIYSTNAGDAALEDDDLPPESELSYCQPYGRTNGVTVSLPICDDGTLYEEVSPQGTAVPPARRPDPLYSSHVPTALSPSAAEFPPSRAPHRAAEPPPPPPPAEEPPVYENVRQWPPLLGSPDRYQLVCRNGALLVGKKRRPRAAAQWRAPPPLTRSCEDLSQRPDEAIYVNASDPIVQVERREAGHDAAAGAAAAQDMSRRLYETAFDSTARPPAPDLDELPRLAWQPGRRSPAAPRRAEPPPLPPPAAGDERTSPARANGASPPTARPEEVARALVRVDVHASPPATAPLPAKFGRDRRAELAGLWDSPECAGENAGGPRAAPSRPERGVPRAAAGRPLSLCGDQPGTLGHRYECLEVPAGERPPPAAARPPLSGDSVRHSCSGSSTLSSLESLRSSSGDSDSTGRGDSLSRAHLSADLCRRLATARLPVLSPISDKSQEPDSPAVEAPRARAGPPCWEAAARPRARSGLHGSDSGISVESHGEAAAPLPFDMPKLRRKAAAGLRSPQGSLPAHAAASTAAAANAPEPVARPSLSLSLDRTEPAAPAASSADPAAPPRRAAMALSLGCATNAAGESIDLSVPFQQQRWYHGAITRVEAETILRAEREGSYLVRICESSRHDHSLSLKSARGFMHMKIRQDSASGKFILGQFSKPFDSIPQMIQHYSMTKLPIRGAEHMSLLHPVADDQLL